MAKDFTEKDLLKGLAKNDKRSVEILYKEHYNMVQSLVINNNGTADDARDIFQEAMIVLYENAKSDHFELNCLIKTYLYSVARRLWLKRLSYAKKWAGELKDDQEVTVPVEEEIEAQEQHDNHFTLMEKALSGLGEPCKSLLEAYYMRKKSMTVIADKFGYTNADNAKNQKYKCLMRLKKIFFSEYKNRLL